MDISLLDIMDPLSYWRDFSDKKKGELEDSARKAMEDMQGRLKAFEKAGE